MKETTTPITITELDAVGSTTGWSALAITPIYHRQRTGRGAPEIVARNTVLVGDALTHLRELPDACVDCVITSPPYHLLRKYGGGPDEIGTEQDIESYVQSIVAVCDELARVLKPTGVLWLNIGDSFSRHARYGAPPKSLMLAPERVLLALSERGWIVRSKVVWSKANHMPASVRDRLSCAWEPLYLLTRSPKYFFDLDAIREPHTSARQRPRHPPNDKYAGVKPPWAGPLAGANDGLSRNRIAGTVGHPLGKNPGDVWTVPTAGFRGAHFAVFPERLIERPLLASCPKRTCTVCGAPWNRHRRRDRLGELEPSCTCNANWRPGLVLDPFIGSGTVGVVGARHGRDWLGIELNPDFGSAATTRIAATSRGGPAATTPPEGGDANNNR